MIITIAGDLGSGKSTVAKELARRLGYKHYSAGDFMRAMAKERGISLLELSKQAEEDESIDKEIDARTGELGRKEDDFVMDSRLAWHFIPHSYKIFLQVSDETGAERIYESGRADEKENKSLEETLKNIKRRRASEEQRYKSMYGMDYRNTRHYDLIIDTSDKTVEEVIRAVLQELPRQHKV